MLRKKFFPALGWTIFIFILCATPGRHIPHVSWLELLSFDKWVHASVFFVEYILVRRFFDSDRFFIIVIGCIAYGGALELMQSYFFSERSGDWFDFIANSFGVFVAAAVYPYFKRKLSFL